jgi:GNAT superfamily N-acetyltransferase
MTSSIRPANVEDIPTIQDIERRAGTAFATIGMDAIANDDPPSTDDLTEYIDGGRAWVAADEDDRPVAYVLVDVIENNAHIEQVTVSPDNARQGLGAALIENVDLWSRGLGHDALTLTTFTDVPWNAPYYQSLGFRSVSADQLSEGLRRVRAHEAELGLDRWPRTAMTRPF